MARFWWLTHNFDNHHVTTIHEQGWGKIFFLNHVASYMHNDILNCSNAEYPEHLLHEELYPNDAYGVQGRDILENLPGGEGHLRCEHHT